MQPRWSLSFWLIASNCGELKMKRSLPLLIASVFCIALPVSVFLSVGGQQRGEI